MSEDIKIWRGNKRKYICGDNKYNRQKMGKKNKFKGFFGNIPRAKLNYFLILENYSNKFVGETLNGAVLDSGCA